MSTVDGWIKRAFRFQSWTLKSLTLWSTLALLTGVFTFAFVARGGAEHRWVVIVSVLYVATALLWVWVQFVQSLSREVWYPHPVLSVFLLVAGLAAVLIATRWWSNGYLLVLGAVAFVLSVGYLELWTRAAVGAVATDPSASPVWKRLIPSLLVGGGLLALIGLNFVGRARFSHLSLVVGVLGLVVLIMAAVLRADREVDALADDDAQPRRARWAHWGLAAYLFAVVSATALVGSVWVTAAFLGLLVLVIVVTSSTLADVALLLGVLALMSLTPAGVSVATDGKLDPAGGKNVLVVLGDSYISGEGAQRFYEGTDGEAGADHKADTCHRAPTSWAVREGDASPDFDAIEFLACSGARTLNVVHHDQPATPGGPGPEAQSGERGTQLDQLHAAMHPDGATDPAFAARLVVMSLGGNDAGFSNIGLMCLAPGDCLDKSNLWTGTLSSVQEQLEGAFAQVKEEVGDVPVVVVAYPDPIYNDDNRKCDDVALSWEDRQFIARFVEKLNTAVSKAAASQDFYFLQDMQGALKDQHLQLCDPVNPTGPGLNFIGLRSVGGVVSERFNPANWLHNSLHPNERGHQAMQQVFDDWWNGPDSPRIAPVPGSQLPGSTNTKAATSDPEDEADPPCSLFNVAGTEADCRDQSTRWALAQVSATVLSRGWGLLILLATLGAAAMSMSFFSWRRAHLGRLTTWLMGRV